MVQRDPWALNGPNHLGLCVLQDVTIITPANVLLVSNLSFSLEPGESLLLVGHNGSGKSSIFRCLGGLWKIPDGGVITKPPVEDFFYIPQKPYNVHGTLADQLTYPETAEKTDVAQNGYARLKEILLEVDLDYLVDRPGALEAPQAWANILSLGEKQRMQIARLIYHKPQYRDPISTLYWYVCNMLQSFAYKHTTSLLTLLAVGMRSWTSALQVYSPSWSETNADVEKSSPQLTVRRLRSSAISTEMEQRLYRIVNDLQVTYVTIAHRPTLRAYHDRMLAIGDGKLGYTLTDIDRSLMRDKVLAMAKASYVSDDEEKSIRAHKTKRDAPYAVLKEVKELPERGTLRRGWRLWILCKPNQATVKLFGICCLIGLSTFIDHISFQNTGEMFAVLMSGGKGRIGRFNTLILITLVTSMAQGVLKESMLLIGESDGIRPIVDQS